MIKMAQIENIRKMYFLEGLSVREISRKTGYHRDTISKYLDQESVKPPKYTLTKQKPHRVLGPFIPVIDEILKADETMPRKQRHTGRRLFERLQDEYGFEGGYNTVMDYLRKAKKKKREAFVPLEFEYGAHGQVDWGEAKFILNGKETIAHLFVMWLGASKGFYVQAYPFLKQEAFFDGHRRTFEFMGGIPHEIAYDNLKTAVKNILKGKDREEQDQFIALRTHYLFNANFCRPARGNEKGGVEGTIQYIQQNFFTPYPEVSSFGELNQYLHEKCVKELSKNLKWEAEKKALRPLPRTAFPCVRYTDLKVNTYSMVNFDTNRYSVPTRYVGERVTIRATIDEIDIIFDNGIIAKHPRLYERNKEHLILDHYLDLLLLKSRALDNTKVYKPTALPPIYEEYRRYLISRTSKANREFVRILLLHRTYPAEIVKEALELAMLYKIFSYDGVYNFVLQLSIPSHKVTPLRQEVISHIPEVTVIPPDISKYNQLMKSGGEN